MILAVEMNIEPITGHWVHMEKQLFISCLFNGTFLALSSCCPQWRRRAIIVTQKQRQWHSYKEIVLEHYSIPAVSGPDNYQEIGE